MRLRRFLVAFLVYCIPLILMTALARASDYSLSPNMSLLVPTVGVDPGPDWANNLNTTLGIIDAHNHTPGNGVQVPPAGININGALTFQDNQATNLQASQFYTQTVNPSCLDCFFSKGVDAYFIDGNGNVIRLTASGSPASSPGNIQGLPSSPVGDASITWQNSQSTFQFTQDSGSAGANADVGSLILRHTSALPNPSGNAVVLEAPSGANYALVAPTGLPTAANSMVVASTGGAMSYITPDGVGTAMGPTGADAVANTRIRSTGTTVGAGGVAISASSGTFSSTSSTPVAITNLSVTITTTGRPVFVGLISDGSGSATELGAASGGGVYVQLVRGSTSLGTYSITATDSAASAVSIVDPVAASTYTYTVEANKNGGTSFYFINVKLVAYEL